MNNNNHFSTLLTLTLSAAFMMCCSAPPNEEDGIVPDCDDTDSSGNTGGNASTATGGVSAGGAGGDSRTDDTALGCSTSDDNCPGESECGGLNVKTIKVLLTEFVDSENQDECSANAENCKCSSNDFCDTASERCNGSYACVRHVFNDINKHFCGSENKFAYACVNENKFSFLSEKTNCSTSTAPSGSTDMSVRVFCCDN